MSQADHLSSAQIEEYVTQSSAWAVNGQQEGVEAHLKDCDDCLSRVLEAHRKHLGLLEGDGMNKTRYPGCPAETMLQELAAGISPPESAEETAEHAAHCDFCGPVLNQYLKEFSDDLDAEDAALARELETSKPKWQKKFVRQVLVPRKPARSFWLRLAPIAAMAVIAAGIVLWQRQHDDLSKAQKLVASAYGERRTTEMRLTSVPYAPYNPVPIERSTEANRALDYERPDLLKAKSLVAEKLHASDKLDPRWLQVEGRIALLDPGSTNDAERALQKAQAEGLNDPSLEIDLAATYFQHASNEENPDFSPAINALTTVLDDKRVSDQDRLAALFDLAIAYQKSKMFDLAIETWEKYLKLDSSSDWAKEAQQRLQDARKAGLPPKAQAPLNSDPAFFFESPFRSGSIGNA